MIKQKLTRKKFVEMIKEAMPQDYNEYEKIAFIEYQVAKYITFDEKYLWGDKETKAKIYRLAQKESIEPNTEVKRKLICVNMAELFGYVATELGFDVRYQKRTEKREIKAGYNEIFSDISDSEREHICPMIGLSNGKYIEIDIQQDLARIQTRSRPKAFGQGRHGIFCDNRVYIDILDAKLIEQTFRKIYGLQEHETFTDDYMMAIAVKFGFQYENPVEMFENFCNDPRLKKELENASLVEASRLHKSMLYFCYDNNMEKYFYKNGNRAVIEECILCDNQGKKRYSFCVYAEHKEDKWMYIYSKKSKRMVKFSQEEIQQMIQQGMKVNVRWEASNIDKTMLSFVNDSKSKTEQEGIKISLDEIFLDDDDEQLE